MLKTEVICGSCDTQFIVVSLEESQPSFCPYCTAPVPDELELAMGDDDE